MIKAELVMLRVNDDGWTWSPGKPVRCESCRWWGYRDPDFPPTDDEERYCEHPNLKAANDSGLGGLRMKADFGCVQWEKADA